MELISSAIKDYKEAAQAYSKAMQSSKNGSKNIKDPQNNQDRFVKSNPVNASQNVLRQGDNLDLFVKSTANTAPSFSLVVKEILKEKINKIKTAEKKSLDAVKGKAGMVEVMNAVNESEIALQQIVTIRDKFVNAYLEILKMPL